IEHRQSGDWHMRKIVVALSAGIMLASAGSALAQTQTTDRIHGTIRSIDQTNRTVTLDNGQTVKLGTSADMGQLRAGGTIDQTCAGGTTANCTLMQPDTTNSMTQPSSPESQTAPSTGGDRSGAGTNATGTGTNGTGSGTSGTGTTGSGGTNGTNGTG